MYFLGPKISIQAYLHTTQIYSKFSKLDIKIILERLRTKKKRFKR